MKPWFIPATTTLLEQLNAFRARREHFAMVVDEYGSIMGALTLEDILEEIVGDIRDEHDVQVAGVRTQPDGSYLIDGSVTLRDLNREFDWSLPDDKASTVAGLVLVEARTIPVPGQKFLFHGFRFEVLRRARNQLTLIRITPPRADGSAASDRGETLAGG
jgi:Mg2+/Co2+ transporter CorB